MKQSDSELDLELKRLKKVKIYQIVMCITLFLAMLFLILWVVSVIKLNAQKKLRGDFDRISLVIKLTREPTTRQITEGEELISQAEAFELYGGPYLNKGYYGMSLGDYLKTEIPAKYFHISGGLLDHVKFPQRDDLPNEQDWIIFSYSDRNVDGNNQIKGIFGTLLDRVNIFVFQLITPL